MRFWMILICLRMNNIKKDKRNVLEMYDKHCSFGLELVTYKYNSGRR